MSMHSENKTIRLCFRDRNIITYVPLVICSTAKLGWLSGSSLCFSVVHGSAEKPKTCPAESPSNERTLSAP